MTALAGRFEKEDLGRRTDLMPLPYAAKDTVAAGFGAPQRASWTVSVLTDAPVVVYAVSGWADGRTVDEPEPAEEAMETGAGSAPAQAGLGTRRRASPTASNAPCARTSAPPRSTPREPQRTPYDGSPEPPPRRRARPRPGARRPRRRHPRPAVGLDAMHTQEAWRTTKGAGVTVAVLDTGVEADHPDLAGNVLEGKDLVGFGASEGDRAWARHGTAMAGIIAGHGHGPGNSEGVMGVAPEAKILPLRVILEDGDPSRTRARKTRGNALADGIRWAADHGADVINLSLGDDSASAHPEPAEDEAIQYALKKGVVVVASAGNGGEKGDHVSYPAAYPGVIAATAVDRYGTRASFSTRRWYATVSAPGVDVIIADPDHRYYEGWGTSAASAFVSGPPPW